MKEFIFGIIGLVIILAFLNNLSFKYEGESAEDWYENYAACVDQVEQANTNIDEANSNIQTSNSLIEDAQSCNYGGCNYEDMQYKISDLQTVDEIETVDVP